MKKKLIIFLGLLAAMKDFPTASGEDLDYDDGLNWVRDETKYWPDGIIKYKFLDTPTTGRAYNETEKAIIRQMIEKIQSQLSSGCITFTEVGIDEDCNEDCVKFDKAGLECKATIGMKFDSRVTLSMYECFDQQGAVVLHELLHVLGASHEQNRPDRDKYVEILTDLVEDSAKQSMSIKELRYGQTFQTIYDYYSVLHYPQTLACKGNEVCIRVKNPYRDEFEKDGLSLLKHYPNELSSIDIIEISTAYGCPIHPDVLETYIDYFMKILTAEEKNDNRLANNYQIHILQIMKKLMTSVKLIKPNILEELKSEMKLMKQELTTIVKLIKSNEYKNFLCSSKGWDYDSSTGICLKVKVERTGITWMAARSNCLAENADLISIHSEMEHQLLKSIIVKKGAYYAWIGLNDRSENNSYKWSDQSKVTVTYWRKGEPSGQNGVHKKEDCVTVNRNGEWNDEVCGGKWIEHYICALKL